MSIYVLFGPSHNHLTILAKGLLKDAGIPFMFKPDSKPITDPKKHPLGIKEFPAIRYKKDISVPIADGIEEIKLWLLKN